MIYFTLDLHFGHEKIIRHTGGPFFNADEMTTALIKNWNRTVCPRDEIYTLRHFTMKGPEYFSDNSAFGKTHFEWVRDLGELCWQNQRFILLHYPIEVWYRYFTSSWS